MLIYNPLTLPLELETIMSAMLSPASLDVAFARFDSENAAIDEMAQANIFRSVADLIEIAQDTGANLIELIASKFAHHQGALELIQAALEGNI